MDSLMATGCADSISLCFAMAGGEGKAGMVALQKKGLTASAGLCFQEGYLEVWFPCLDF